MTAVGPGSLPRRSAALCPATDLPDACGVELEAFGRLGFGYCWYRATEVSRPRFLRHTAASVWLGAGADPKMLQRVLGHATAAMTMDLHGVTLPRRR